MLKKLNIIYGILLGLMLCLIPLIGFLYGFASPTLFITVLCVVLLGHPILYLVILLIKEAKIFTYDSPPFAPLCMVITVLGGCLLWYLFYHIEFNFSYWIYLWYGCVLLVFAVPIIVFKIIALFRSKKSDKGPKMMVRK